MKTLLRSGVCAPLILLASCSSRSSESVLFHSLCRIARAAEVLAEVEVISLGKAQQIDLIGDVDDARYTPVSVLVTNVIWGNLDADRHDVLVYGEIDADGRSQALNGTYKVEGQPTSGLMFLTKPDGRLVQVPQGYFRRSGESFHNDAWYSRGVSRDEVLAAKSQSDGGVLCFDDDNPPALSPDAATPNGDARDQ